MRAILLMTFLLIVLCTHAFAIELSENEIKYTFKHSESNANQLEVKVEFLGSPSGQTTVITPWGGAVGHLLNKHIKFAIDNGGKAIDSNSEYTTFLHHPNARFTAEYTLTSNKENGSAMLPIIENAYIVLYPATTMLYPAKWDSSLMDATFDFSQLNEKYHIFSSYGLERIIKTNNSFDQVRFSQFFGSIKKPEILSNAYRQNYITTIGEWKLFKNISPTELLKKIIAYQRQVMKDENFPYYVACIVKQPDEITYKFSSGLHNNNTLFLYIPDSDNTEKFSHLKHMFSHESFHAWIGNKIKIPPNIFKRYRWFSEGFTDYFGLKLAHDGGFVTHEEYANILNYHINNYYNSIFRTISNQTYETIYDGFHAGFNFIQTRGHLVALLYDISHPNNGFHKLKNFIKDLVHHIDDQKQRFSESVFWELFEKNFDPEFKSILQKHIFDGNEIVLPNMQEFELYETTHQVIEPGFDVTSSLKAKVICNVQENTPAHQAGLRNNTPFIDIRVINDKDNNEAIAIILMQDNKSSLVQYVPNKIERKILNYRVRS